MTSLQLLLAASTLAAPAVLLHGIENEQVSSVHHFASRAIERRDVAPFTSIRMTGIADLFIAQGPKQEVQVDADEDVASRVTTQVDNGVLVVKTEGNFRNKTSIKVYVTIPDIREISTTGTGDVIGMTPIKASDLHIATTGTGEVTLDLAVDHLSTKLSGTGNMHLSGHAQTEDIAVVGTGDFQGRKLNGSTVSVRNSGTGDVEVNASNALDIKLTGTGSVRYSGSVKKVESSVTGVGSIRKVS